ncbi:MAG: FTR1 family iron permease [Campylobacter sp.]|nr:FTR1 family iron permease [Campylobacter sp.]
MNKFMKFLLILLIPFCLFADDRDYATVAQDIKKELQKVIAEYKAGDVKQAVKDTQNAYFGHFEYIESGIRINISSKKSFAMEKQFGNIRKAIKAGKDVAEIQAMVDNLNAEIQEVLPIIESGHKLVGEYSDTANVSDLNTSNFAPQWRQVFDNIQQNFSDAISLYAEGKKDEAKNKINSDAKFINYRNSKLEEAIRKDIKDGQGIDASIQRKMGEAVSGINNAITQDDFKNKLNEISKILHDAIAALPAGSESIAAVKLEDEAQEAAVDFSPVVKNINDKMAAVLELYKKKDAEQAMSDAQDIYFDEFEASGMENKVGAIDVGLKTNIEGTFSAIVASMKAEKSEAEVKAAMDKLASQLNEALELTSSSSSPWSLFIWSLTIILREGFEALIIVAAVVAYLVKTGNQAKMGKVVYSSVFIAIVLSFVMAWIMNIIFGEAAGQKRELVEGITMLVAVGLLFYVGFWLLSNAGAKKWSSYIQGQVDLALSNNSVATLWWTVFLAVFREGAETVLFYQALIFDAKNPAGYSMIAGGFVLGVIILLIVYFLFKIFAIKIPIKPFFLFTSAIIFYMSIVFTGKGIMELVEGKIFIPTTIEGLKFPEWASSWLGLNPYYESLIPQIALVALLILGIIYMKSKPNKS